MAKPIIEAIRQRRDLKESVLHTAQELAHRASIYGVARVSLRYLAMKCHCCKQTIINHLNKLIELKILKKRVIWLKGNLCETNTYTFLLAWKKEPAQTCHSQNFGPKFPPPEGEKKNAALGEEKGNGGALRDQLENQRKTLRALTPGSGLWQRTAEEVARLEALVARE
jgi:hypothetical protein